MTGHLPAADAAAVASAAASAADVDLEALVQNPNDASDALS